MNLLQSNYDGFIQIDKYELSNKEGYQYDVFDKRQPTLSIRVTFEKDTTINWWGDGRATINELRNFQRLLDKVDEIIRGEY